MKSRMDAYYRKGVVKDFVVTGLWETYIPDSMKAEFDAAIAASAKRMADEIDAEIVASYCG